MQYIDNFTGITSFEEKKSGEDFIKLYIIDIKKKLEYKFAIMLTIPVIKYGKFPIQ